jgi:Tetracyclin repressor-like, C-terminal domain
VFMRLFGRTLAEPSEYLQSVMNQHFGVVTERFGMAFRRALPQLPPPVLHWRFQFVVGAMGYIMADPHNLRETTGGLCDPANTETAICELTAFLAAGLRAAVPAIAPASKRNSTKRRFCQTRR